MLSLHSVSIAPFLPKNLVAASKVNTDQASNSPQPKVRAVAPVVAEKGETTETRKNAGQYDFPKSRPGQHRARIFAKL